MGHFKINKHTYTHTGSSNKDIIVATTKLDGLVYCKSPTVAAHSSGDGGGGIQVQRWGWGPHQRYAFRGGRGLFEDLRMSAIL